MKIRKRREEKRIEEREEERKRGCYLELSKGRINGMHSLACFRRGGRLAVGISPFCSILLILYWFFWCLFVFVILLESANICRSLAVRESTRWQKNIEKILCHGIILIPSIFVSISYMSSSTWLEGELGGGEEKGEGRGRPQKKKRREGKEHTWGIGLLGEQILNTVDQRSCNRSGLPIWS